MHRRITTTLASAGLALLAACAPLPADGGTASPNPVELGAVRWGRDLDAALASSTRTEKPVLALFQEIPG
jgi:hypothetical protein